MGEASGTGKQDDEQREGSKAQVQTPAKPLSWAELAKKNAPAPPTSPEKQNSLQPQDAKAGPAASKSAAGSSAVDQSGVLAAATAASRTPASEEAAVAVSTSSAAATAGAPAWGGKGVSKETDFIDELRKHMWPLTEKALAAEPIVRQPRGLCNMGNLCFMNAVLQGLVGCSAFFRFLHSLRTMAVPARHLPTLHSLVKLASEFNQVESAEAASDAGAEILAERGGGGYSDGAWQTSASQRGGGGGAGSVEGAAGGGSASVEKYGPPLRPEYLDELYEQVNLFAPNDPVRPRRGKARQEVSMRVCLLSHEGWRALRRQSAGASIPSV